MHRFFAVVLVLAVTLAVSLVFAAWITSLHYSLLGSTEVLRPLEAELYKDSSWRLRIVVVNEGSRVTTVKGVEVVGVEHVDLDVPVKPGEKRELSISLSKEYVPGAHYAVKLHLASGVEVPLTVEARE